MLISLIRGSNEIAQNNQLQEGRHMANIHQIPAPAPTCGFLGVEWGGKEASVC